MPSHEAFMKAIRIEPNEPFHEQVYGDFLRDEGYDPPDEYVRQARYLAPLLHSAQREFRMPNGGPLGAFGLEVLLSCAHLHALRELHLSGYATGEVVVDEGRRRHVIRVVPNVGEAGVIRLVRSPLMEQTSYLDLRCNNLGEAAIDALAAAPGLILLERLVVDEPEHPLTAQQWARLRERLGERVQPRPSGTPWVPQ